MAYHGELEADNPYDSTSRNERGTEALWHPIGFVDNGPRERESRDWTPKLPKSNYPRELIDLATEEDREMRYDIAARNRVREHLAAAGLADPQKGISDWERYWCEKQKAKAKQWREMVSRSRRRHSENRD